MNKIVTILKGIVFIAILSSTIVINGYASPEPINPNLNISSTDADKGYTTLIGREGVSPFDLASLIDVTPQRIYNINPETGEYYALLKLSVNKVSYNKAVNHMNAYFEANKITSKGKSISTIRPIATNHIVRSGTILRFIQHKYDNRKKAYDIELAVANDFSDQYNILLYLTTNNHKMHYLNLIIDKLNIEQEQFQIKLDLVDKDGAVLDNYSLNLFDTSNLSLLFDTKDKGEYTVTLDNKNKILSLLMPPNTNDDVRVISPYITIMLDDIEYHLEQLTIGVKIYSDASMISDIVVKR